MHIVILDLNSVFCSMSAAFGEGQVKYIEYLLIKSIIGEIGVFISIVQCYGGKLLVQDLGYVKSLKYLS